MKRVYETLLLLGVLEICWFPLSKSISRGRDIIQFHEINILHQVQETPWNNAAHNEAIRTTLLNFMHMLRAERVEKEASRTQFRGFYLATLALILSVILTRNSFNELILLIPLFVIFTFYALEIHQDDLNRRYNGWNDCISSAQETLLNSPKTDTTSYIVTFENLKKKLNDVYGSSVRRRKALNFLKPEIDQYFLFLLPMLLLTLIPFWRFGRHHFTLVQNSQVA